MTQDAKINAPNYTQIPNAVFDYWMSKLKPTQFMILCCLCRKIFGWHKTSDTISVNQLSKITNLGKSTINVVLNDLEILGLIEKIKTRDDFGDRPNEYKLNLTIPIDVRYVDEELERYKEKNPIKEISKDGSKNSLLGGGIQNLDRGGSNFDLGGVSRIGIPRIQNLDTQKKDLTKEREHTSPMSSFPPSSADSKKKKRRGQEPSTFVFSF